MPAEEKKTKECKPVWLKPVWFSWCHSYISGSYLKPDKSLNNITLEWMLQKLRDCVKNLNINEDMLVTSPNPLGMQYKEVQMFALGPIKRNWPMGPRSVHPNFSLHASVLERLRAARVSHIEEMKPYRPIEFRSHLKAKSFYDV